MRLMPVQRVVGGIEVENDLSGRRLVAAGVKGACSSRLSVLLPASGT